MKTNAILKYFQKRNFLKTNPGRQTPCFKSYNQIGSIALFVSFLHLNEIEDIVSQLKADGKDVVVYVLVASKRIKQDPGFKEKLFNECEIIETSRFSWIGIPDAELMKKVSEKQFDAILDFAPQNIRLHHLIVANSCNFRIGIESLDYSFYDFSILREDLKSFGELFGQIKKYLSSIHTTQ